MGWLSNWRQQARRLKHETYALYLAYSDPRTPWHARVVAACVVAYAFSPIDLIPDFVPVLGYLDDLILVPLGIALAIRLIPPEVMAAARQRAAGAAARPTSWPAAALIVTVWVGLAALGIWLVARALTPAPAPPAAGLATPSPAPSPSPSPTAPPSPSPAPSPSPSPTAPPSPSPTAPPAPVAARYGYPIGLPGLPPGDGFIVRHGAQVENTWYAPGNWHAGEDWYALEGDTGGAPVLAAAAGEVVYAGANYPGRVVILAHPDGLYSMYGHLDPRLEVAVGDQVARGQRLGVVLEQRGARAPSHLHFEIRAFLTAREVNGEAPRYGYRCGPGCPPGPGYWPIEAPDLPVDRGWYNPTHVIARRMAEAPPGAALGAVAVATRPVSASLTLWSAPPDDPARQPVADLPLRPGERLTLLAVWAGEEAPRETSALAYALWYAVRLPDGREGWAQAAVPAADETGADGRPSSVRFNLFPVVEGPGGIQSAGKAVSPS